jgi:transcriptional regulator with XRE-family HTH domain
MTANPTLGSIIRGVRMRKNWTLKEMSERTGIPLSTLAKVEHDRLTLTYDKLLQLSQSVGMGLTELLGEAGNPAQPAVTARRSLGEIDRAVRVATSNYDYYYLCPDLRRKRMIPIVTRILAGSIEEFGDLVRHSGEEYVYVIEGSIIVHTEFYNPVTLHTHQSIYIDSQMGHAYVKAEGCEEAKILSVCSSSDEQFMESPVLPATKPAPARARRRTTASHEK